MSYPQIRRLVPSLVLFLLWPAAAFTQTPTASPNVHLHVRVKADFVVTNTADVDNLGINFDLLPLTAPDAAMPANQKPAFLQYAVGSAVAQSYQTLTRSRGKIIHIPPVTAADETTAVIRVDALVPDGPPQAKATNGFGSFPRLTQVSQVQGEMTLIPRSHPDGTVTLSLVLPGAFGKPIPLKTVRSGDMLVFSNLIVGQDIPFLGGIFRSRSKISDTQELLIFVTPTILGTDARKTGMGKPELPADRPPR